MRKRLMNVQPNCGFDVSRADFMFLAATLGCCSYADDGDDQLIRHRHTQADTTTQNRHISLKHNFIWDPTIRPLLGCFTAYIGGIACNAHARVFGMNFELNVLFLFVSAFKWHYAGHALLICKLRKINNYINHINHVIMLWCDYRSRYTTRLWCFSWPTECHVSRSPMVFSAPYQQRLSPIIMSYEHSPASEQQPKISSEVIPGTLGKKTNLLKFWVRP